MIMKKTLLTLVAALVAGTAWAQKVTWDMTENPFSITSTKTVEETTYSNGTYSIKLAGSTGAGFYFNSKDKYLMLGKQGAYLQFPAFDFAVGKIVVTGHNGASGKTKMNLYAGETEVSTQTTGSAATNTYAVAAAHQTAGTVYTLKINSADNARITKIEIFEATGEEPTPNPGETVTIAQAMAAAAGTNVKVEGQVVAVTGLGGVIADATGFIYHYQNVAPTYAVGDAVTVQGALAAYQNFNQFTADATVTTGANSSVTYPTPTVMDGAALDAFLTTPVRQYVKVSGTLNISGNYYNLNVEGASTAVGSIIKPSEALLQGLVSGSKVTVEGYALYKAGTKYVNIATTKITIDEAVEDKDIRNTPETAYTTTQARAIIAEGKGLGHKVYVKGIVAAKGLKIDTNYGNATYNIVSAGTTDTLYIYRGYFGENIKFTSEDQIQDGDEVIVYGQLMLYNNTSYQMAQGNYIYSLNGIGTGITEAVAEEQKEATIYDLNGRRVAKPTKGIYIINGKKVVR